MPSTRGSIIDGQLGATPQETDNVVAIMGYSSLGTVLALVDFDQATASDVKTALGKGKLAQTTAAVVSAEGHGQTIALPLNSSAGTNSAVTAAGTSPPTVTVTGTPLDDGNVRVEMLTAGARGTATFRYCKDYDAAKKTGNWSPAILTAATYTISDLDITLNFAVGTYATDNTYDVTCTGPTHSNAQVTAGFDALLASGRDLGAVVVLSAVAGATDADRATAFAALYAAVSAKLDEWDAAQRPLACVLEAPSPVATDTAGTAAWIAALNGIINSLADERIMVTAGYLRKATQLGGGDVSRRSLIISAAEKFSVAPIDEDFGRVMSGPLPGVSSIEFDKGAVGGLDDRYTTATSIPLKSGFYFTESRQTAPLGSDYELTQNLRVINRAYKVLFSSLQRYRNEGFFTAAGGKIREDEAQSIDGALTRELKVDLVDSGHASAASARISRTDTILTTKKLRASGRVRPKGYAKDIEFDVGLTAD